MKVFYSWQSDLDHERHLKFIREALQLAVTRAGSELELEEANRPELDEAATGRKGAENIVSAILRKIESAAVYVADVTPIIKTERNRLVPNPNVIFELGWASKAIDYERSILVMNVAEGYEPKDMPFDIVQRPILTYSLKKGANADQRQRALARLTDQLAGAIKSNLAEHIEDAARDLAIPKIAALSTDFTIWTDSAVSIQGYYGDNQQVLIPKEPRAYMRIMPAGWKGEQPSPDIFCKLPENLRPEFIAPSASSGNNARCTEGAIRYWMTEPSTAGRFVSNDLAVYFETFGEVWVLIGAIGEAPRGKYLDLKHAVSAWRTALTNSMAFMDQYGAKHPRNVEAGVNGMKDVWLSTGYNEGKQSLKTSVQLVRQDQKWDERAQLSFRFDLFNLVRAAFVLPPATFDQFAKFEGRSSSN